jgi:hypothetical protein
MTTTFKIKFKKKSIGQLIPKSNGAHYAIRLMPKSVKTDSVMLLIFTPQQTGSRFIKQLT